jgi:hypothetical protein
VRAASTACLLVFFNLQQSTGITQAASQGSDLQDITRCAWQQLACHSVRHSWPPIGCSQRAVSACAVALQRASADAAALPEVATKTLKLLHFNDVYNIEQAAKEPVGGAARFVTKCRELQKVRHAAAAIAGLLCSAGATSW